MSETGSSLVLLLLILPSAGAIAAALLGTARLGEVCRVRLGVGLVTALLALILAASVMSNSGAHSGQKTFNPSHVVKWELVKLGGDASEGVHFFIGLDGIN